MRLTRATAAVLALVVGSLTGCDYRPSPTPTPTRRPVAKPVDYSQWAAGTSRPRVDRLYPDRGNPNLDVLHYDLRLSWDPAAQMLTGLATLQIRPLLNDSSIVLDFAAYQLDRVEVGSRAVARAAVSGEKLVVPFSLTAEEPVTLSVAYHGKPVTTPAPALLAGTAPLGLTISADGGLRTFQQPYGAFTWYPVNDQPSDEALYDVAVTVPAGWAAVAAGTPNGSSGNTYSYRSTVPLAPALQTLAVDRYASVTATGPHGIPLTYWYRPALDQQLLPTLRKSASDLAFLEQRFGRYPFRTGGVVVVDAPTGAPSQQTVTVGGRLGRVDAASLGNRLVYDWAYQWFGASVTPASWDDAWLAEGWATYAQYLYQQATQHVSDQALDRFLRTSDAELRSRYGPPAHPSAADVTAPTIRVGAAAMLHRLRLALGDGAFFALATAWAKQQRTTQPTRATFVAFVNRRTGRDFTGLIDAWLDSPTTPR